MNQFHLFVLTSIRPSLRHFLHSSPLHSFTRNSKLTFYGWKNHYVLPLYFLLLVLLLLLLVLLVLLVLVIVLVLLLVLVLPLPLPPPPLLFTNANLRSY